MLVEKVAEKERDDVSQKIEAKFHLVNPRRLEFFVIFGTQLIGKTSDFLCSHAELGSSAV